MEYHGADSRAKALARIAHHGQVDKNGKPIIDHVSRVAAAGKYYGSVIVGYLHDIVEDTPVTLDDLRTFDLGDDVVEAVDVLTRRKGEIYTSYILRIAHSRNAFAREVKIADLEDHLANDPPATLITRYENALAVLRHR